VLDKLKADMMTRAMKLITDPQVMRVLSNPKVTNVLLQAMMLKGRAEQAWSERAQLLARQLNLATQQEVEALKAELDALRSRVSDDQLT
jgi:hypothetical protein